MGNIQIWHHFSLVAKYWNISMILIIGIFQFHCRSEHKQIKWNKIKREMCKSDSIFNYLQRVITNITDEWRDKFRRMRDQCRWVKTREDKWETNLYKVVHCLYITFEIYFLIRLISKMNDNR